VRTHLGIDDTDSLSGGCTTKIAADLVQLLTREGVTFLDYPSLIRLNPNIPWKTRGNGAVCLRMESTLDSRDILELAIEEVERSSKLDEAGTDPAVAIVEGEVPSSVLRFGKEALTRVVTPEEATSMIREIGGQAIAFGSLQGTVGALAAIGTVLDNNFTFELIAYRHESFIGKPRLVDKESIVEMDGRMRELTFNSVDPETKRILITPRGPDPILCGIRGENPRAVGEAFRMLRIHEPVGAWMIFRTNQGTDAHLTRNLRISEAEGNSAVVIQGTVEGEPRTIQGGHVIFSLKDESGSICCAAYEPTGSFRKVVKMLREGDKVRGFGGIRPAGNGVPKTLNLEKLEVVELAPSVVHRNPVCPVCGKRMKSAGRNQGFRCERCKTREFSKVNGFFRRELTNGVYLPPPRAHRHLTKPMIRYARPEPDFAWPPESEWHHP
jgi:tRNA(Ile2)-agmatinylcytidine synthase